MAPKRIPAEVRFLRRVHVTDDGCWNWTGAVRYGYGRILDDAHRLQQAHRWAYMYYVGPVPDGLVLDHLCRNRACVNPDHLEPVTQQTNVLRGVSLAAQRKQQTHCKYGHEFTESNTARDGKNRRVCRKCRARNNAVVTELRRAGIYTRRTAA